MRSFTEPQRAQLCRTPTHETKWGLPATPSDTPPPRRGPLSQFNAFSAPVAGWVGWWDFAAFASSREAVLCFGAGGGVLGVGGPSGRLH